MKKYFFWLTWEQPLRQLASLLFGVLVLLIACSTLLIIIGPDGLLGWHTFSQKSAVDVISQTVNVGVFSFSYTEQLMVIKEFVSGGEMPNTVFAQQVVMLTILALFTLILVLITYLNRFGFIIFSTLVFFFIIFLHPEMLKLADVNDNWILSGTFLFFIGSAYYFQAYGKNVEFGLRLIIMFFVMSAFIGFILLGSNVNAPLNFLFSYGILAPYLVLLLFIFMVGHEIVNGFILAIANTKQEVGNNRIKHFLAISVIYLINVLLSYLQITHVIDWSFITVNPIFLLSVAAILGVWGISQRFILYKKVNSSQQVWVLLYLAIAVISYCIITYLLFSLEDPFLKIISDFIIFTQLAFGSAFLLYVLYNFISIIEQGHSIKNILYKPQNLPHVSYRVLGVAILTGLVLMRDINYPVWYSLGGYYNSIAGYFEDTGNDELAAAFYERGADLSKRNHKSNYKLGMFQIDDNRKKAIEYFGVASERVPTPQAFVNKANLEASLNNYFDALFTLQEGARELPNSIEIRNNLGLQFGKSSILDSAWHYFSEANSFKPSQNNALAFVLKNNFSISAQDSSFLFSNLNKVGLINAAALGFKFRIEENFSGEDMLSAALLNNALIHELIPYSPASYMLIKQVVDSTKNEATFEELNYALAMYELANEQVLNAFNRLQKLSSLGTAKQSEYLEILGLINLEEGSYTKAEEYFLLANEHRASGQKTYFTQLAVAQSEAGYFTDAIQSWERVKAEESPADSLKAVVMIGVLESILNQNDSIQANDISLYLKARYQRLWVDEFEVKSTFERITDTSLKNELALELASYYFNSGNKSATKLFYDKIDVELNSETILEPFLKLNIRLAYDGLVPDLETQVNNLHEAGFGFSKKERLEEAFYTANRKEISEETAEMLGTQNPFFAEALVWAAQYYKKDSDSYRSYNLLQGALNYNPDNRLLLEAYILEAISIGLEQYANNSLQHYRELFPGDLFYSFLQKVEQERAAFDAMAEEA